MGFFTALSTVGRLGQLVEVQGEKGHAEAAECDEQVLGGEGHSSRYKNLFTNVTEAQGCVAKSFLGLWAVLFFYDLPVWCHQDRLRKSLPASRRSTA